MPCCGLHQNYRWMSHTRTTLLFTRNITSYTTQHNTTQHNKTQHNTTQHNTTKQNTTQHNTAHTFQTHGTHCKHRADGVLPVSFIHTKKAHPRYIYACTCMMNICTHVCDEHMHVCVWWTYARTCLAHVHAHLWGHAFLHLNQNQHGLRRGLRCRRANLRRAYAW